jgi:type IV/VI secretion system ImpK/VasF family protein
MSDQHRGAPHQDLTSITRSWFLFLTTFRRNAQSMDASVEWTRNKLQGLLDEMTQAASTDLKLKTSFDEAKYPLVYFADEVLLNCGWPNEGEWERKLLEIEVFQTQHAGQDFFRRAEDPGLTDQEVIKVYFKCICLGFAGQYADQPMLLREMRERLFARLSVKQQEGTRFCPAAYDHTDRRNFVKLPMVATARITIATLAFIILILWVSRWTTANTLQSVAEGLNQIQEENRNPNPWQGLIDLAPGTEDNSDSSNGND